jgi:hypothetical protein
MIANAHNYNLAQLSRWTGGTTEQEHRPCPGTKVFGEEGIEEGIGRGTGQCQGIQQENQPVGRDK